MKGIPFENRLEARKNSGESAFARQYWRKLLFLHWKWDALEIQKTLPPGLFVDTFKGDGYVSLIPFLMEEVKIKNLPPLLGFSNFIEVNVRTYVYDKQGVPGIWFYSLDIDSWLAAKLARMSYSLPYFYADLRADVEESGVNIYGKRVGQKADINFKYQRSNDKEHPAAAESLEFFLLERYFLFSYGSNCLYRGQVHHAPYQITTPAVAEWSNDLLVISGFNRSHKPPDLVHYSHELLVDVCQVHKVP